MSDAQAPLEGTPITQEVPLEDNPITTEEKKDEIEAKSLEEQATEEKSEPEIPPVIGIDFGTQKCVLAASRADEAFLPRIVPNNLSNDSTPTVVSFKGNERLIGELALNAVNILVFCHNQVVSSPATTITQIKRLLGRNYSDSSFQEELSRSSFPIKDQQGDAIFEFPHADTTLNMRTEEIAAQLLRQLREDSSKVLGCEVRECVLAIPGAWGEAQVNALADAARIADWQVLGFIPSPTAGNSLILESPLAALCHNFSQALKEDEEKRVTLFMEMGHSYFGAEVVSFTKDSVEVLAAVHDETLGARLIDDEIVKHAAQQFQDQTKKDVFSAPKALNRLRKEAERVKQILSTIPQTDLTLECLMDEKDLRLRISRAWLEDQCGDFLKRLSDAIQRLLSQPGIDVTNLQAVEVVGGGLRIPMIQSILKAAVAPIELSFTLDSAHCVAMGAALWAKSLQSSIDFSIPLKDPYVPSQIGNRLSDEKIEEARTRLQQLVDADHQLALQRHKRNEFETLLYLLRNRASEATVPPSEQTALRQRVDEGEEWLFDNEEASLETFEGEIATLNEDVKTLAPAVQKLLEEEEERKKREAEEAAKAIEEHAKKERSEPRTKKEKLEAAAKKRHQGTVLFKDGDFEGAAVRWGQAVSYLSSMWDMSQDQKRQADEIKLPCYLNLSACFLKLQKFEKARENCTEALKIDAENVKALYRRGQALYYLKEFEAAKEDLTAGLKLDPKNSEIRRTLKTVQDQLSAQLEKEKKIYGRMFG